MTARDEVKPSDLKKGRKRTPPKVFRPQVVAERATPLISDHAVLRYMERVMGLEVEKVRSNMLTPMQLAAVRGLREVEVPIGGGHYAVVRNGRVVTVI